MRKMKDIEQWFGELPTNWGVSRISSLYTLRNTKVSDKDYMPLSVTMKGIVPQLETAAKTNAHDDRKLVRRGDFAINSRSDRRGSCGISEYDGSVSLINTILAPLREMNPHYYNWLFHTIQFADEFYKWGHGIVDDLWTTGWQDMKKIMIPVPPLQEQKKIAVFLDTECSEIDSLSADIQAQIDTLEQYKKSVITEAVTKGLNPDVEMKDSGVEWLGMIPKNWTVSRLGGLYRDSTERGNDELPILTVSINTGISDRELSDDETVKTVIRSSDRSLYKKVMPGDLAYNMMRAWQGAIGCARVNGMVSPAYVVAKPIVNDIDSRYIEYLLRTPTAIEEMHRYSYGIMDFRLRLYWPNFKNIKVCLPPYEEQKSIASYIDNKCTEIDSIIDQKKKQIKILEDYKKSIIYEYVTGKKEVPNE